MSAKIGLIGLGRMGTAIAESVLGAGYELNGWSRSGVPEELSQLGIVACASVEELVEKSGVILTSLTDDEAVLSVMSRIASADPVGKIIADTSTITAKAAREAHQILSVAGAQMIDAPIAGGPGVVRSGMAGCMMGGDAEVAESLRPLFECFAKKISHFGEIGNGMIAKTVNNTLGHGYFLALARGMELSERSGIDRETMLDFLATSPMASGMMAHLVANILGREHKTVFTVDQILSDCDIFMANYRDKGLVTSLQEDFAAYYHRAQQEGLGKEDLSAAIRLAADRAT